MSMSRTIACIAVIVSPFGCGSGISGFADELEDAVCAAQVECRDFLDMNSCLDATVFDLGQLVAGEAAGRVVFNADQTRDCIDMLARAAGCDYPEVTQDEIDAACDGVFTGTVELGGECFDNEECLGESSCDLPCDSDQCCSGTCVADEIAEPVAIGEDCSAAECVAGAYCGEAEICVAVGNEGEACPNTGSSNGAKYCAGDLFCDGYDLGPHTCVRPAAEGEECNPTLWRPCGRRDLWCSRTDNTCQIKKEAGETCDFEAFDKECAGYAPCFYDVCVARPRINQSCDAAVDTCSGDLVCDSGHCRLPEADPVCGPG